MLIMNSVLRKKLNRKLERSNPEFSLLPLTVRNYCHYLNSFATTGEPSLEFTALNNIKLKADLNSASNLIIFEDFSGLLTISALMLVKTGKGSVTEISLKDSSRKSTKTFTNDYKLFGLNKIGHITLKKLYAIKEEEKIFFEFIDKHLRQAQPDFEQNIECDTMIFCSKKIVPDFDVAFKMIEKM